MAISDYSATPASNTAISGINIDEGCPPANINDAIRQLMADIAGWGQAASVTDYGAAGDGVTDDRDAIQDCIDANDLVLFPAGTYLVGSSIALTASHSGLNMLAHGATIEKGFNGDLFTYTAAPNVKMFGGYLDGDYASYTGRAFVLSGASDNPVWIGVSCIGFSVNDWEFGADSGKRARLNGCLGLTDTGAGQAGTDLRVYTNGPDTGATQRSFSGCNFDGYIDASGALDTFFSNTACTYVDTDANTNILTFCGGIWGNSGGAVTITGEVILLNSVRLSAAVTLVSGSSGSFVGNVFTSGGLTDNSLRGDWFVAYHPSTSNDYIIGNNELAITYSLGERIQTSSVSSIGDQDLTWNPHSNTSTLSFATPLTAPRAITLSTTGATNGTQLRVTRSASGASALDVGGLKSLAADEWCTVEYNGSAYILTSYGSL